MQIVAAWQQMGDEFAAIVVRRFGCRGSFVVVRKKITEADDARVCHVGTVLERERKGTRNRIEAAFNRKQALVMIADEGAGGGL